MNNSIFTGDIDLDLEIIKHLNIDDLERLSQVKHNHVFNQKHFWINKLTSEGLIADGKELNLKTYIILQKIANDFKQMKIFKYQGVSLVINPKFKIDYYVKLFNQYSFICDKDLLLLRSISINMFEEHKVSMIIIGFDKVSDCIGNEFEFTIKDFKDILFKMYYDNAIK